MSWKLRITGPQHELHELSQSLCNESFAVSRDEYGQYYLACSRFDKCKTSNEVLEIAVEILGILNGATKLALGGNLGFTESGVLEQRPDGTQTFYMHVSDTIHVRESFVLSVVDSEGNVIEEHRPADPIPIWLQASLDNDALGKVFRLFGQQHDWVNLYKIFEVIESDVGGVNKIAENGWSTKTQVKTFKHTANSPNAVGDDARHGKEHTEPPKSPMLLSEARVLVETLVHHWLRSKGFV